jgi:hypothetical protein
LEAPADKPGIFRESVVLNGVFHQKVETYMAQLGYMTVSDAQATPVAHNFYPNGRDDKGTFWLIDRSQASAIGFWKISIEFKEPAPAQAGVSSKDRSYRVRIGLHEPVLETLSNSTTSGVLPAPTIAYVPRSFTEFILPERASLLDRQNLRKMMANIISQTAIASIVETLDRPY